MRGSGLSRKGVATIRTAVGPANQPSSLAIDAKVIKVEQIAAAGAGRTLQADGALLNRIVRGCINRDPVSSSIISCSYIQVPDVFAVEGCAIRIASYSGGYSCTGPNKSEGCAVIVARDYDWKYGMGDAESSSDVGVTCPGRAAIAGVSHVRVAVPTHPSEIDCVCSLAGGLSYTVLPNSY